MTDEALRFIDHLHHLAWKPECSTIILTGTSGSGKTSLAKALENCPHLGILRVSLDYWIKDSTQNRIAAIKAAQEGNNTRLIQQLSDQTNIYDWRKFYRDFKVLRQTGSLALTNVYKHETGELTDNVFLKVSLTPPHIIILEGCALLHDPVVSLARLAILLDIPRNMVESRRQERDRFKKTQGQILEANTRLEIWGNNYFSLNRKNAVVFGEKTRNYLHYTLT